MASPPCSSQKKKCQFRRNSLQCYRNVVADLRFCKKHRNCVFSKEIMSKIIENELLWSPLYNRFLALPSEIRKETMTFLDYSTILELYQTCPQISKDCEDEEYWSQKAIRDFGITREMFAKRGKKVLAVVRYLRAMGINRNICTKGSERIFNKSQCLQSATRQGNRELIEYFRRLDQEPTDSYEIGLIIVQEAAEKGYKDIMDHYIEERPKSYFGSLYSKSVSLRPFLRKAISGAAKGGHYNLIQELISRDLPIYREEDALEAAISGVSHTDLVLTIIRDYNIHSLIPRIIGSAINSNNLDLLKFLS